MSMTVADSYLQSFRASTAEDQTKHSVFHGRCGSLWPSPSLLLCLCGIRQGFLLQRSVTCWGAWKKSFGHCFSAKLDFQTCNWMDAQALMLEATFLRPAVHFLGHQVELLWVFLPLFLHPTCCVFLTLLLGLRCSGHLGLDFCFFGFPALSFGVLIWMHHGLSMTSGSWFVGVLPLKQVLRRVVSLTPTGYLSVPVLNLAVLLSVVAHGSFGSLGIDWGSGFRDQSSDLGFFWHFPLSAFWPLAEVWEDFWKSPSATLHYRKVGSSCHSWTCFNTKLVLPLPPWLLEPVLHHCLLP